MSDSLAPRNAELILESLGAETEFREAVIGDLAEEFAIRLRWDGPRVARRWYYRECVRVAPYLLRDWWRGLRPKSVGHLLNAMLWSSLSVLALESFLQRAVRALVLLTVGRPLDAFGTSVGLSAFMLLWTLIDGVCGGYVAAWLGRRAPVPSALSLGVLGSSMILLDALASANPLWFRAANVTALVAGVVAGGLIRVYRRNASTVATSLE